jgi:CheY-like chemotaxis protein
MDDYIAKPFKPPILKETLKKWISLAWVKIVNFLDLA